MGESMTAWLLVDSPSDIVVSLKVPPLKVALLEATSRNRSNVQDNVIVMATRSSKQPRPDA